MPRASCWWAPPWASPPAMKSASTCWSPPAWTCWWSTPPTATRKAFWTASNGSRPSIPRSTSSAATSPPPPPRWPWSSTALTPSRSALAPAPSAPPASSPAWACRRSLPSRTCPCAQRHGRALHRRRRHPLLGRHLEGPGRGRQHRHDGLHVCRHRRSAGRSDPVPGPQLQVLPRHGQPGRDGRRLGRPLLPGRRRQGGQIRPRGHRRPRGLQGQRAGHHLPAGGRRAPVDGLLRLRFHRRAARESRVRGNHLGRHEGIPRARRANHQGSAELPFRRLIPKNAATIRRVFPSALRFHLFESSMHSKILILDFGSQVTQPIARRVRDRGVFSEGFPYDVSDEFVRNYGAAGVILSGSHSSTLEGEAPKAPQAVFELGVPVLGICYGMQTMAQQLGGKVENGAVREFGYAEVRARGHMALLNGINDFVTDEGHGMLKVWMSHGDKVLEMPPGFKLMGNTPSCPIAAMADEERHFYGVQFHPEVTHTVQGKAMLGRFVHEICGCKSDWNMPDYISEAVEKIRAQVGKDEVILGLSGGVDSSVAAALIHRAIGDQLTCVFVDHGLLRLDEGKMVMDMFAKNLGVKVIKVDAEDQFLGHLAGVSDPEAKRKIIGREFVEVFQAHAKELPSAKWLAQGTIYPDVI